MRLQRRFAADATRFQLRFSCAAAAGHASAPMMPLSRATPAAPQRAMLR